jgi:hypothetical protein
MKLNTGTIKWGDGTTSRVVIKKVETYSWLPSDYWIDYAEGETHKPLVHPDFGTKPEIKAPILLPEEIFFRVFIRDVNITSFEYKLDQYIKANFGEKERHEAENLFKSLVRLSGEDYVTNNYLENK